MTLTEMVMKTGKRGPSFAQMINHVGPRKNPIIVETGCARLADNFEGDGMSTLIFDELASQIDGKFYSVDINPENAEFALKNTKVAEIHCGDSVKFLHELNTKLRKQGQYIDLLYLDSFDFDMQDPHPSSLHHILELVAIWPSCREGTMICVDDNFGDVGKGGYVKQYMDLLGKNRVWDGYQWVWLL